MTAMVSNFLYHAPGRFMSLEILPVVLTLTFYGVCGMVGGILVQDRRDRSSRDPDSHY